MSRSHSPQYRAFLLRCWHETTGWRYSLEQAGSGERRGFADAEALLSHLQEVLASDGAAAGAGPAAAAGTDSLARDLGNDAPDAPARPSAGEGGSR